MDPIELIAGPQCRFDGCKVELRKCDPVEFCLRVRIGKAISCDPLPETPIRAKADPGQLRAFDAAKDAKPGNNFTMKARLGMISDFGRSFHSGWVRIGSEREPEAGIGPDFGG